MLEEISQVEVQAADKSKILNIWKIAGLLLIVTGIEFVFAYSLPDHWKWMKISIFVGLTFVKAFYIVSEFMHLKHERKVLIWSLVLPMILVVWLLIALIYEGGVILEVR